MTKRKKTQSELLINIKLKKYERHKVNNEKKF